VTEKEFLNGVAKGKFDLIQNLLDILSGNNISYCIIGGLAVNAYVEPVISLDLDIVITTHDISNFKKSVLHTFEIKEFPHSIHLYHADSDLRVQIQTDHRYQDFISNANDKHVLGYLMKVASIEDVLKGKIWTYMDLERRQSKRQKDLADIFRIIESFPNLESLLPHKIRKML
jgi:hypothetical protein